MSDLLDHVAHYLESHWKVCSTPDYQRVFDIDWYAKLNEPYGPMFADRLAAKLKVERTKT